MADPSTRSPSPLILIPLLSIALLTGCSMAPSPTSAEGITTSTATPSPAPIRVAPTLTSPPRAVATDRPEPPACGERRGSLAEHLIEDGRLTRPLPFRLYLPPCFDPGTKTSIPVLFLMHGLYRDDSQWDDLGADEIADQLITSGELPPFVMAMPWERTGIDLEIGIMQVLMPYIQERYSAGLRPEHRAVGGISRGGGWALRIGLKHPEAFGAIGLHSPVVLPPDLFFLADWLEGADPDDLPELWVDVGDRDTLRFDVMELAETFERHQVPYSWVMPAGEHTAEYWQGQMEGYLRWYLSALNP